jgi:quercetin dioxygenase-like cupin family protein
MNRKPILTLGLITLGLFACERSRMDEARRDDRTTSTTPPVTHVMGNADELKWGPPPPGLPSGAQAAVVDGDPTKTGVFVVRLKAPDGYTVPPHTHPTAERLTILSGTFRMGEGEKLDDSKMKSLTAGGYVTLPAGHAHYAKAVGESIIQITSDGPFQINYIDPKDDPRRAASGGGAVGGTAPGAPAP